MDDLNLCPICGNRLRDGAAFCDRCGARAELLPEKHLHLGECPKCGSARLKVLKVDRPWRLIRCLTCRQTFRSVEVIYDGADTFQVAAECLKIASGGKF